MSHQWLRLDGSSDTFVSTPDANHLDVVGDIDIRAEIALDNWATGNTQFIVSKWSVPGNQRSYSFSVTSDGKLQFQWTTDGVNVRVHSSSVVIPVADNETIRVRATLDVDNGSGGYTLRFYTTSPEDEDGFGDSWIQLGSTITITGITSIFASTASIHIGANENVGRLAGKVSYVEIYDVGTDSLAALPTFNSDEQWSVGTQQALDDVGNLWSLQGNAFIEAGPPPPPPPIPPLLAAGDRGVKWIKFIHPHPDPHYDQTDIELLSEDVLNTAYDVVSFDLGHPSSRDVTRAVPHIDGERDTTRFHGSRIMTINVKIFEHNGRGPNYWRSKLRQFMHPGTRFFVEFMIEGSDEPLRAHVRCDTSTYEFSTDKPSHLEDTIILTVPSGRYESATEKTLILRPEVMDGGRTYPLVYPRVYPNIGPIGGVHVHNYGNARANAKFRIYGPMTGPILMNHSMPMPGSMHGFMSYVFMESFEIQPGSYVEINPDMRTITMNGMVEDSLLHMLHYEHSVWWSIEPTHNDLMLGSVAFDRPAQAHILWRDTYL